MDKELNIKGLNMHCFRFISALLMLFTLSANSYAELTGSGEKSDPYIIDEPEDIPALRDVLLNDQTNYLYVKQVADIDLEDLSEASNENRMQRPPLPLSANTFIRNLRYLPDNCFYGEYDGGGHTIKNWIITSNKIKSDEDSELYISLFGKIGDYNKKEKSIIKNLNIDGFSIEIPATMGNIPGASFLTSYAENAEITNCHVTNSRIYGDGHFSFGSIAALTYNCSLTNCSVRDSEYDPLQGAQTVGSICGANNGTIKNCFAYNVTVNGDKYLGGIVGEHNGGTIENCGFNGKLGTSLNIRVQNSGGICGKITGGSILNCFTVFNNGGNTWKNVEVFGGIVGDVPDNAVIKVQNCYTFPQVKLSNKKDEAKNVDFVVGRDMNKDGNNRLYESCYSYENAFGKNYVPNIIEGKEFSDNYKKTHNIVVASNDYMRSGCFAEILYDFYRNNFKDDNPWREDIEFKNDTLPVFGFMFNGKYNEEPYTTPFCHPGIYTVGHDKIDGGSLLKGQMKYVKKDQATEGWVCGFEVKVGNGKWDEIFSKDDAIDIINDFVFEYSHDSKRTIVFRAFTCQLSNNRKAYGQIDTLCIGTSTGPEQITIEGCDTVVYEGKVYLRADDGKKFTNANGDEVTIKVGESRVEKMPLLKAKDCSPTLTVDNVTYDHSGVYKTVVKNETGCMTTKIQEVKLYPKGAEKDSLKVFSLGEMSYTYVPLSGENAKTVNVGSEYVLEPKTLYVDKITYSSNSFCDSATINVKYVIPIKFTKIEDDWTCTAVNYNGVTYKRQAIIGDTIKTPDAQYGMLYDIKSRHIKAAVPDTIIKEKTWCGVIQYECPSGICETTEPFSDTVQSIQKIDESQCPATVTINKNLLGTKPSREETVVSCGPYKYVYKGKTTIWKESKDYKVVRSGKNVGSCDNDTIVIYHVTIGASTHYNDTTIHGCEKVVYKTFSGDIIEFKNSQVFEDEISTPGGCSSKRKVNIIVHKAKNNSSVLPITGCAPMKFTKLNGEDIIIEAGNTVFKDTLKSLDGCGCDSIIKTTTFMLENPTTFKDSIVLGCDEVEIEGVKYAKDTSFVLKKSDTNIFSVKVCRTQFQPYVVKINSSVVNKYHIDTCGTYTKYGQTLEYDGVIENRKEMPTGCDEIDRYDVRIIKPTVIDSVVYACDNYVYKYFDGHQEMVEIDGTVLYDKLQSKVCKCDSIIRKITVNISHDSYETLPTVTNCGPFEYVKKSNGKKVLITTSQIVKDTLLTKYGCHVYYDTEVNIIPVETKIDTLDACKEYHSVLPVFNYGNLPVDVILNTPTVDTAKLIFLKNNETHPICKDTTKLFLIVHGVGTITAEPVVECDSFIYIDYDGSKRKITTSMSIVDTLKSTLCDCDSVIKTTNITINKSIPESLRKTNNLRNCDSVVYVNSKGKEMTFMSDTLFLDTFQMKSTGCDSVVIVDVNVPKSTGSVTLLTACGDTTLFDETNSNFPHVFDKSGVWRQVLSQNAVGCSNYKEWHVTIIPTPRDTIFETGCGELTFRGDTYTSENEKASSFGVVLNGATKCDTIHNYILTVYPKYSIDTTIVSCDSVIINGNVYKNSIYFRDSMISRNNCDSIINYNIVVNHAYDEHDYVFGCNEVKFMDEDYNGGKPVYVHHDSTIYVDKMSDKGCPYIFIQQIEVGHPSYSVAEYVECFNTKTGYASFRGLKLTSDTIIFDTIQSRENKCGAVIANKVRLTMPVYETVSIFECLDSTIGYVSFRDLKLTSDTVIYDTLTSINNCDSIVANKINFINPNQDSVIVDSTFGCNQVKFTDINYNNGLSVKFDKDTTISFVKTTEDGCSFQLTKKIKVGHSSYAENEVYERYDTKMGYATYRELRLAADTVIYETIPSIENECGTVVKNIIKLMMPVYDTITTFECVDPLIGYVNFRHLRLKADTVIYDTVPTLNNYDSIAIHRVNLIFPVDGGTTTYVDTAYGCIEMNFVDADFNGGMPIHIDHDTTIIFNKKTAGSGCDFQLTQYISIGMPDSSEADVFECFDSKSGYVTYRDLKLTNDTVIYELISSDTNRCGTIMKNNVNVIMPIHDTIYIDSCLHITYEGVVYRDSAEVVRQSKTVEMGCDSFTHVMLNVNHCFPYPVLVNKYNWILVCNDNILDESQFKLKSNVKYKWYKDERLMLTTTESFFTEDKELDGCYQVGIVVSGGAEYLSDVVCIDENHGYTITTQPNPVEKLQPVTIKCDFPVEGVPGTKVEVFNMKADKVYVSKATSSEIVIPGMTVSGYYFVRLTTVSGKVLTAKYLVK